MKTTRLSANQVDGFYRSEAQQEAAFQGAFGKLIGGFAAFALSAIAIVLAASFVIGGFIRLGQATASSFTGLF
ncbi:hypothetical protein [Consotaella aegiceratis]|uniref:hypothetical protein n=1 Tax=Consotaella aegiceratis TaxID=3097961 RepID=UPI002F3FE943